MITLTYYKDGKHSTIISGATDRTITPYDKIGYNLLKKVVSENKEILLLCNRGADNGGGYDSAPLILKYVEVLDISDHQNPHIEERFRFDSNQFAQEEGFKSFDWLELYLSQRFDSRKKYLLIGWYVFDTDEEKELFLEYKEKYPPLPFPNKCDGCGKICANRFAVDNIKGGKLNLCVKCLTKHLKKSGGY